ncbi:MAG: hypothetical protein AAF557_07625 [Pseudomonadota bacterium]
MAERAIPFTAAATGSADGVSMDTPARGSIWQIAAWPETFETIESDLAKVCGCAAPGPGKALETLDGHLLIRTEPLKWWVLGPDGAECPLTPNPEDGVWLDMSHDQVSIALTGPNAAEILKRMVSIDVRDHAFPNLSFATTHMHHMITKVLRRDDGDTPRYEVMVMRSYADDLREITQHHLHHFGH